MASLNEYLKQNFTPTVANEVGLLIELCVASALDNAINAIDNDTVSGFIKDMIEPERIITEMFADFTSMVQAPLTARGTLQQQQSIGRGLRAPSPVDVIPMTTFTEAMAKRMDERKRELMNPVAQPFGVPTVVDDDEGKPARVVLGYARTGPINEPSETDDNARNAVEGRDDIK